MSSHQPKLTWFFVCASVFVCANSVTGYASPVEVDAPPCNLNGVLGSNGACVCDLPWVGSQCETLSFKPVSLPQGYGTYPNITTWGGNILYDSSAKEYHMYVSRMTNECPLSTWGKNSRIDHAVSTNMTGPFEFRDVAVPTWAHNAAPIKLKDGSYAIVHIGMGNGSPNGGENCSSQTHKSSSDFLEDAPFDAGSTIHTSKSLNGPWEPLMQNTLGSCNNPAPWVHSNGTIYIVCGESLKRTENISGPWETVTTFSHSGGPPGNYEDPFLYTDKRGFHLIYHVYNTQENPPHGHECTDSTVSAHGFSLDGFQWFMTPVQPYTTQVQLDTGATLTVATRERPKIYFNEEGQKTHVVNGVCGVPNCPNGPPTGCVDCKYANWDFTLVQPLATE